MLAREPEERLDSAGEVAEVLSPFCDGHSLNDLAECGMQLALQEAAESPLPHTTPPVLSKIPGKAVALTPQRAARQSTQTNRFASSVGIRVKLLILPLVLLAGVVIWIQTDVGTVMIECPDEGTPIEIRRGKELVQTETLVAGPNEITVRSGNYEIVIPGKYDSLKVEDGKIEISRGSVWSARITRTNKHGPAGDSRLANLIPAGMRTAAIDIDAKSSITGLLQPGDTVDVRVKYKEATNEVMAESVRTVAVAVEVLAVDSTTSATGKEHSAVLMVTPEQAGLIETARDFGILNLVPRSASDVASIPRFAVFPQPDIGKPVPVFSGKTFEQWRTSVLTERNPEELTNAVSALCILGRGYRDREAAETVLQILGPYQCENLMTPNQHTPPASIPAEHKLVQTALLRLRRLDSAAVVPAIITAFESGNSNIERLVLQWLAHPAINRPVPVQVYGQPDPLRSELNKSPEFLTAIINKSADLKTHHGPYPYYCLLPFIRGEKTDPRLIKLLESFLNHPSASLPVNAARELARIQPKPELTEIFLSKLEERRPFQKHSAVYSSFYGGTSNSSWWESEGNAWLGLAELGNHAASYVDRIAGLLKTAGRDTNDKSHLDDGVTAYTRPKSGDAAVPISISRRVLIYELLGRLGPSAGTSVGAITTSLATRFRVSTDANGTCEFEAADRNPLFDALLTGEELSAFQTAKDEGLANSRAINSALLAVQRITGQPATFAKSQVSIVLTNPYAQKGKPRGRLDLSSLTKSDSMAGESPAPMGGIMPGGSGAGDASSVELNRLLPRMVRYKGRGLQDWMRFATNSSAERSDKLFAVTALSDGTNDADVATAIDLLLRETLGTTEFYVGNEAVEDAVALALSILDRLHSFDRDRFVKTTIELASGKHGQAEQFIVREIVAPEQKRQDTVWPKTSHYGRQLRNTPEFVAAYSRLFETWNELIPRRRQALLTVAAQNPGLSKKHLLKQLTKLLIAEDALTRTRAAIALARTKPQTDALKKQVSGVLLEAVETTPDEVHLLDVALALPDANGGTLDGLVVKLVELIQRDCASGEPLAFKMTFARNARSRTGTFGGAGGFSGMEMMMGTGGGGGGRRMAGMSSGFGIEGTIDEEFDLGITGVPDGTALAGGMGSTEWISWTIPLSRRIVLTELLGLAPPGSVTTRAWVVNALRPFIDKSNPRPTKVQPLSQVHELWKSGARFSGSQSCDPKEESTGFQQALIRTATNLWSSTANGTMHGEAARIISGGKTPNAGTDKNDSKETTALPKYDGREYEEWLEIAQQERNPTRLIDAFHALRLLGAGTHDRAVAKTILDKLNLFSLEGLDARTDDGKIIYRARDELRLLDPVAVEASVVEALRNGNANQRRFVLNFFFVAPGVVGSSNINKAREVTDHLKRSQTFRASLVDAWDGSPDSLRPFIIEHLAALVDGDRTHEGVVDILEQAVHEGDFEVNSPYEGPLCLRAARFLADTNQTDDLAEIVLDYMNELHEHTDHWRLCLDGYVALYKLGPKAISVEADLNELLKVEIANHKSALVVFEPHANGSGSIQHVISPATCLVEILGNIGTKTESTLETLRGILQPKTSPNEGLKTGIRELTTNKTKFVLDYLARSNASPPVNANTLQTKSGPTLQVSYAYPFLLHKTAELAIARITAHGKQTSQDPPQEAGESDAPATDSEGADAEEADIQFEDTVRSPMESNGSLK